MKGHIVWISVMTVSVVLLAPALSQGNAPIKVLAIGAVLPINTPIVHWCADEPLCVATIIPTRLGGATYDAEEAQRMIRLYFPRRLDRTTVDVIIFSAGDVVFLTTSQIAKMMSGVEEGVGALADVGGTSVISQSIDSWVAFGMGTIFPNDVSAVLSAKYTELTGTYPGYFLKGIPYTIEVRQEVPGNPFTPFVAVGIEQVHGYAGRKMVPKPGSTVMANVVGGYGFLKERTPFSLSWEYGQGRTVAVCEWFGHPFWSDYGDLIQQSDNPYSIELFVNLLLFITERPIFQDILEIHAIKEQVKEYRIRRGNLISVIDFASEFGASMAQVEEELDGIEEDRKKADALYLEGDYAQTSALLRSAVLALQEAFDESIALKNRALAIVYVSEWFAVTGTLVISGTVIYEVMIRRRAYREVGTTSAL